MRVRNFLRNMNPYRAARLGMALVPVIVWKVIRKAQVPGESED